MTAFGNINLCELCGRSPAERALFGEDGTVWQICPKCYDREISRIGGADGKSQVI